MPGAQSTPAISCIIVEDELMSRIAIESLVAEQPFLRLAGSFEHAEEALDFLRRHSVDLLFLDIDLPQMNGLELLKSLPEVPLCILVTSHAEYALEGFELQVLDFLLKPLEEKRFVRAVKRVKELLEMKQKAALYEVYFEQEQVTIKEGHDLVKISLQEIVYLEALKDYTKIITEKKQYLTLANLKNFLEQLPAGKFVRIHRSYAVLIQRIRQLRQQELIVQNDIALPIGKTYRQELLACIKNQK